MKQLTVVIRHFYPFTRPSGVISSINELLMEARRRRIKLSLVCIKRKGEKNFYKYNDIDIYKFNQFNFLSYIEIINKINTDKILFISSMSTERNIFLWWGLLSLITKCKEKYFYQTTNLLNTHYNTALKKVLSSFKVIFSASISIQKRLKETFNISSVLLTPSIRIPNNEEVTKKRTTIKNIGFFGHLAHIKGVDIFLDIAKEFHNINFLIVAGYSSSKRDKEFSIEIRKRIRKNRNITFIGPVKDPLKIMNSCDLLILPYRDGGTILGTAQSAIEAMSLGKPVIGTINSALTDLVKTGKNGFLCSTKDQLIKKTTLLISSKHLYNTMSLNALRTIKVSFNIKKTFNIFEKYFYERI